MTEIAPQNEAANDADALKALLAARDAEIARLNRRIEIDNALRDAGAIDFEAAEALLERSATDPGASQSIAERVAEVKRRKPFLFESERRSATALGPKPPAGPSREFERAAAEAASTGRRTDLLRYLRLRRKQAP